MKEYAFLELYWRGFQDITNVKHFDVHTIRLRLGLFEIRLLWFVEIVEEVLNDVLG